jgi:signal transduction histidine kinase
MWFGVSLCLAAVLLFSVLRHLRIAQLIRDVADALEEGRPYLLDRRPRFLIGHPISRALRHIRELQEENAKVSRLQAGHLTQIEVTLGNIQEAVFILNESNYVILANLASRELLGDGRSLNGLRIESIIRSSSLLDYVDNVKSGKPMGRREIEISRGERTLWFEVSGTLVSEVDPEGGKMTLFVLHDISRLKHLERVRKEFVGNVSHELRTPLTIIKGYSDTLVEDFEELPVDARRRFLEKIQGNVNRLNLLIEDLLTLSRLESSPERMQREPLSLRELVAEVLEQYEERIDPEKQRIRVDFAPEVDVVPGDRLKLTQTFQNLLDNIMRYASGFTEIMISACKREDGRFVEITVADNGSGIPPGDLPHIFERFYRVDKGRSRETGGTGLGLSIVKHIVQLHGGDIEVESEPGEGTSMRFNLLAENREEASALLMRPYARSIS